MYFGWAASSDGTSRRISPNVDVLVTDDNAFRDTSELIPNRPFALAPFDDLVALT